MARHAAGASRGGGRIGTPVGTDYGAVCDVGGFLEARHTHWIDDLTWNRETALPSVRNHIRVAKRESDLRTAGHPMDFRFDKAIVGVSDSHVAQRRRFAQSLAERGLVTVLEAVCGERVLGQILMIDSDRWRLVMHSWFCRDCGIRGVPSLLLLTAMERSLVDPRIDVVDLEGSIVSRVDEFMDGVGGALVPYAIVYWYREKSVLLDRLRLSLQIPERSRK
jgi:hypothetical protein